MSFRRIEKIVTDTIIDLSYVIVIDEIRWSGENSLCIRCHDLHGPLPKIALETSGNTLADKDELERHVCKTYAISRIREDLIRFFSGGKFLPATSFEGTSLVGFRVGPKAWLAEGKDFWAAYHQLHGKVLDDPAAG